MLCICQKATILEGASLKVTSLIKLKQFVLIRIHKYLKKSVFSNVISQFWFAFLYLFLQIYGILNQTGICAQVQQIKYVNRF